MIIMLLLFIDPDTKWGVDYSTINHEQHSINEVNKYSTLKEFHQLPTVPSNSIYFFLKDFLGNISPFCGATDTPVLDFG